MECAQHVFYSADLQVAETHSVTGHSKPDGLSVIDAVDRLQGILAAPMSKINIGTGFLDKVCCSNDRHHDHQ